jgi:O-methyltransferase
MGIYLEQAGAGQVFARSCLGNKLFYLELLASALKELELPGLVAEAGVYKGGSAKLLATIFNDRDILLFDSFQGMLENDSHQKGMHQAGDFSDSSLADVQQYLASNTNCKFYPGWFPSSADFLTDEQFVMVHLDMDYYQSTQSGIEVFWPRLVTGGILVLDDFGWKACPGVDQAFHEYFSQRDDYERLESPVPYTLALCKK